MKTGPSRLVAATTGIVALMLLFAFIGSASAEALYWKRINQDDPRVELVGRWMTVEDGELSMGAESATGRGAAHAEFTFTGTGVRWIGTRGIHRGRADIHLNGELLVEGLDTHRETTEYQAVIFEITGLKEGEHVLRVDPTGGKHPEATMNLVSIDAFEYLPGAGEWRALLTSEAERAARLAAEAPTAPPRVIGYLLEPYYPESTRAELGAAAEAARRIAADEGSTIGDLHDTLRILREILAIFHASARDASYRAAETPETLHLGTEWPVDPGNAIRVPHGDEAAHAEVWILWDDDHYYLQYDLTTDFPMGNTYTGHDIWRADSIEFALAHNHSPSEDEREKWILGRTNQKGYQVVTRHPRVEIERCTGVDLEILPTEFGRRGQIIFDLDHPNMEAFHPNDHERLLFFLCINDSVDGVDRTRTLSMYIGEGITGNVNNPKDFLPLTLLPHGE